MATARNRERPSENAHEAVKILDINLRINRMSRADLAKKSGVAPRTLADWWYGKGDPHVAMLEAALNVFGLRLKVSGIKEEESKK